MVLLLLLLLLPACHVHHVQTPKAENSHNRSQSQLLKPEIQYQGRTVKKKGGPDASTDGP